MNPNLNDSNGIDEKITGNPETKQSGNIRLTAQYEDTAVLEQEIQNNL